MGVKDWGTSMPLSERYAIEAIISGFVERALPDAHDWEDGSYRLFEEGPDEEGRSTYFVEADIPTSGFDCWLDFGFAVDDGGGFVVTRLHGMRSGTGVDSESVYVWEEQNASWQLASVDEGL